MGARDCDEHAIRDDGSKAIAGPGTDTVSPSSGNACDISTHRCTESVNRGEHDPKWKPTVSILVTVVWRCLPPRVLDLVTEHLVNVTCRKS